jgi:hypothetical protein
LCSLAVGALCAREQGASLRIRTQIVDSSTDASRQYQLGSLDLSEVLTGLVSVHSPTSGISRTIDRLQRRFKATSTANDSFPPAGSSSDELRQWARRQPALVGHVERQNLVEEALKNSMRLPIQVRGDAESRLSHELRRYNRTSVAVHVRLTDYAHWNDGASLLPGAYYRAALAAVDWLPAHQPISLFSDDPNAALAFLIDELPRESRIQPIQEVSPSIDLLMFSRFNRLVLSHSTFAWWAGRNSGSTHVVHPGVGGALGPSRGWLVPEWRH